MGNFGIYSYSALLILVGLVSQGAFQPPLGGSAGGRGSSGGFGSPLEGNCKTKNNLGPENSRGKPCVFPFILVLDDDTGETAGPFNGCTDVGASGELEGEYLCSTKTNADGYHVEGEGNYGVCSKGCPLPCTTKSDIGPENSRGKPCVFPFTLVLDDDTGETAGPFNRCTDVGASGELEGEYLCSTKTNADGYHVEGEGNYGVCSENCPLPGGDGRKNGRITRPRPN